MEPQANARVVLMTIKSHHRNNAMWMGLCLRAAEHAQLPEASRMLVATKGRKKVEKRVNLQCGRRAGRALAEPEGILTPWCSPKASPEAHGERELYFAREETAQ